MNCSNPHQATAVLLLNSLLIIPQSGDMSHSLFLYQNPYLTKYLVGFGWAVTKYQIGIALLSQSVALFCKASVWHCSLNQVVLFGYLKLKK